MLLFMWKRITRLMDWYCWHYVGMCRRHRRILKEGCDDFSGLYCADCDKEIEWSAPMMLKPKPWTDKDI